MSKIIHHSPLTASDNAAAHDARGAEPRGLPELSAFTTDTKGQTAMPVTIKTNNVPRNFVYRHDVPEKVLASQFDHLSEDDAPDGFVKYRGYWYHTSDFMRIEGATTEEFNGWHGYSSDSYFSGVLIRISDDGESCVLGTYFS